MLSRELVLYDANAATRPNPAGTKRVFQNRKGFLLTGLTPVPQTLPALPGADDERLFPRDKEHPLPETWRGLFNCGWRRGRARTCPGRGLPGLGVNALGKSRASKPGVEPNSCQAGRRAVGPGAGVGGGRRDCRGLDLSRGDTCDSGLLSPCGLWSWNHRRAGRGQTACHVTTTPREPHWACSLHPAPACPPRWAPTPHHSTGFAF